MHTISPIASHTEQPILQSDPWQQWQALAALFGSPPTPSFAGESERAGSSSFAPGTDFAEHFNAAARAYLDGDTGTAAATPAEAARLFGDRLRDLFANQRPPWNFGTVANTAKGASPPDFSLNAPAFGATREHQLRWQRMTEAWQHLDEAQRRLQRLWSDALREAAATFAARLDQPPPAGGGAAVMRKLYDTWIDCAEGAYFRVAHSAPFCDALADSVNAGSQWQREFQAHIEHSAKLLDLPTRSEINTLLRRLRALEDQLRVARTQPKAHTTSAKKRPRRKAKL